MWPLARLLSAVARATVGSGQVAHVARARVAHSDAVARIGLGPLVAWGASATRPDPPAVARRCWSGVLCQGRARLRRQGGTARLARVQQQPGVGAPRGISVAAVVAGRSGPRGQGAPAEPHVERAALPGRRPSPGKGTIKTSAPPLNIHALNRHGVNAGRGTRVGRRGDLSWASFATGKKLLCLLAYHYYHCYSLKPLPKNAQVYAVDVASTWRQSASSVKYLWERVLEVSLRSGVALQTFRRFALPLS